MLDDSSASTKRLMGGAGHSFMTCSQPKGGGFKASSGAVLVLVGLVRSRCPRPSRSRLINVYDRIFTDLHIDELGVVLLLCLSINVKPFNAKSIGTVFSSVASGTPDPRIATEIEVYQTINLSIAYHMFDFRYYATGTALAFSRKNT